MKQTIPSPRTHAPARCRLAAQPGQSMVELALALGILLLIVFGGIAVIQVLLTNYTVERAARAAAHQAALDGGWTVQAQTTAAAVLDGAPWTSGGKRTIGGGCSGPCRRYSPIAVAITYTDVLWAPVPFFSNVTAQARAVRAAEQDQGTAGTAGPPGGTSGPIPGPAGPGLPGSGPIPGPGTPGPGPQAAPLGGAALCSAGGCR